MSDAIATSLVGSYPQPDWLVDREALNQRLPPRLRARELWRIDAAWLRDAQDDAVIVAIADQERAGLSIITDGEIRRESYSNHFANALEGVDLKHPGTIVSRAGTTAMVPRVLEVLDELPGKTIMLGVIALDSAEVEDPKTVAGQLRRALQHKGADELVAAPDCGMKYLPREAAFAKLEAMVAGAGAAVRS